MKHHSRSLAITLLLFSIICGCTMTSTHHHTAQTGKHPLEKQPELAVHMSHLQRHSQKLGYSIERHNKPLSEFYLHELHEALEEVEHIKEDGGFTIGDTAKIIMEPLLTDLGQSLSSTDWPQAQQQYTTLIDGCNRCHAATEHQFIHILPAHGPPPFNQSFDIRN